MAFQQNTPHGHPAFNTFRVVVTDLDGTLLDHDSYDFTPANPALERLNEASIPVILCSSKTRAEIEALRGLLNNDWPFIVENGAAVCGIDEEPAGDRVFGREYGAIRDFIVFQRKRYHYDVVGFGDMDTAEIAACTGLSLPDAERAKAREFSEPVIWRDSEKKLAGFLQHLQKAGFSAQQGGRFLTLAGDTDKGRAVRWLRDYYRRRQQRAVEMIALGDSPNDEAMLNAADIAVVVLSERSAALSVTGAKKVIHTKERGPAGWCSAINQILEDDQ